MRGVVALIVVAAALACASPAPTIPPPGETPSPWSPLAVYAPNPDGNLNLAIFVVGTLVLTEECVFLDWAQNRSLVVFRESPQHWTWDTNAREFVIPSRGSGAIRIGDGDPIWVAGGGRGGAPMEQILARLPWLSPPDPDCLTPEVGVLFADGEIRQP